MSESKKGLIWLRLLWLFGILSTLSISARAEQLPIKSYTTADGLAHDRIKRIVRDGHGFLWFCTGDGLSRFDGYGFTNYSTELGLSKPDFNDLLITRRGIYWAATNTQGVVRFNPFTKVPSTGIAANNATLYQIGDEPRTNRANVLYQDQVGRVWVGTDGGLFCLEDEQQGSFHRVEMGFSSSLDRLVGIYSLIEDVEGSLWIGTTRGLVRRLPDGQMVHYLVQPPPGPVSFESLQTVIETLLIDPQGRLWMGHRHGLTIHLPEPVSALSAHHRFSQHALVERAIDANPQDGTWHLPTATGEARRYTIASELPGNHVWALHLGRDGRIRLGLDNGDLMVFDGQKFHRFTTRHGLSGSPVFTLTEDIDGDVWLGTQSTGVLKIARSGFVSYRQTDGLGNNLSTFIFENQAGELCVVSGNKFISRFDGQSFTTIQPNLPASAPWDLLWRRMALQDHTGEWWVGTGKGLYRFPRMSDLAQLARARPKMVYTTSHGLTGNDVYRLFEDSRGDLWIGTDHRDVLTRWERATNNFHRYSAKDGLPSFSAAVAFGEDRSGALWFGFYEGGLARYREGRFTFWPATEKTLAGLIGHIYLDHAGRLWIASRLSGLIRIDEPQAEQPRFITYTTDQGLASNSIRCLTEDQWGRIYIGTVRGVDRLDPVTGSIKHYTTADGLANVELQAAYRDHQGALWFGTLNGLSRLMPELDPPPSPPTILISGLRIEDVNQPISLAGEVQVPALKLNADQNDIEIEFLGLSFGVGERLRYQYRLEGAHRDWSPLTEQRSVNYASLPPGRYRFEVRAMNTAGITSLTPAVVSFIISPPLWQRWWVVTLVAMMAGLTIYALYRYRLTRLLELERIRTRIATDLHDDLGANLSQVAILSEVAHQQIGQGDAQGIKHLSFIARVSRESVDAMSDIVWAINPQRDWLSDLTSRMRRFASEILPACGIEFRFHAPEPEPDVKLGVDVRRQIFLIFKEGINNIIRHAACTEVACELRLEGAWLVLRLSDNGRGFDLDTVRKGHGLESMRRRAESLGGQWQINSNNGQGVTVLLRIPYARRSWLGVKMSGNGRGVNRKVN